MIKVNGKRISNSKANAIVDKTVENIILVGFTSSQELINIISSNTGRTLELDIKILNKLLEIYSSNLVNESKKIDIDNKNPNISMISDKLILVVEAICMVNNSIKPSIESCK